MITTAAVLRGAAGDVQGHIDEHLGIEEITLEEPRSDEVLVRIVASGICHSDLAAINGDLPISRPVILGHEGSGIVERVGSDVASVRPGDPVVLSFASCGACRACRTGHPVYCARSAAMNLSGTRADGSTAYRGADRRAETIFGHFVGQSSFAHHALVHESAVVKVGADVELAVAAPLGCGIQTGAGSVMNVLRPAYGSSLAVTGTGSVGLSAVMAAKVVGCEVIIAVDVNDARLELAGRLGATHTLNPTDRDLADELRQATGGRGVDFCLDTTGRQSVIRDAFSGLAPMGELGLVGVSPAGTRIDLDPWAILAGRSVRGNMEGDVVPGVFLPYLINLHQQGRFPFDEIITECGGLPDMHAALKASDAGTLIKAVLQIG